MSPLLASLRRRRAGRCTARQAVPQVPVVVAGGYHPDVIHAQAGVPLRLLFRREESSPCSEQVVFPMLGKSASLPQYQDVPVEIMIAEPGVYDFTCAMGMLHGQIIVSPPGNGARTQTPSDSARPTERGERE